MIVLMMIAALTATVVEQPTVTVQRVRYETSVEMRPVCVTKAVIEEVEVPVCVQCQACTCSEVTVYRKAWFQRRAARRLAR